MFHEAFPRRFFLHGSAPFCRPFARIDFRRRLVPCLLAPRIPGGILRYGDNLLTAPWAAVVAPCFPLPLIVFVQFLDVLGNV